MVARRSIRRDVVLVLLVVAVAPIVVVATVALLLPEVRIAVGGSIAVVAAAAVVAATLLVLRLGESLSRPLVRLAESLYEDRDPHVNSSYLADLADDPVEVRQVKKSLRELVSRVDNEARARATVTAAITHDLRTPLIAGIRAIDAQLARENPFDEYAEALNLLRGALGDANVLAGQLVDVQRFGGRSDAMRFIRIDLRDVVDEWIRRLDGEAKHRGIRLTVTGSGTAVADAFAVGRAVANLVDNALRHATSAVTVGVFAGVVRVEDDGTGLSAPIDELVQPFRGALGMSGAGAGHAGLGLYIADQIARAHGGRLALERSDASGSAMLLFLSGAR